MRTAAALGQFRLELVDGDLGPIAAEARIDEQLGAVLRRLRAAGALSAAAGPLIGETHETGDAGEAVTELIVADHDLRADGIVVKCARVAEVSIRQRGRFVKGDIRDTSLVESLLAAETLDTVVHFAAESHVDRSIAGPDAFIETNVVGTHSLLKAARQVWLERKPVRGHRFHHVSTDEVYGSLSLHDAPCTETAAFAPNSPYSASKAAAEHLVRAYHRTYELDVTISNCSNNYGPHHFPEKLIPLMIVNLLQGKPLPIYGDGRYVRDWIYVDDHCRGIELVIGAGAGADAQLRQRFPAAAAGQPSAESIEYVRDRPGHDRRYALDCTKISGALGYRPTVSLEEGLDRTLCWYIDNEPWWRAVMDGSYRRTGTVPGGAPGDERRHVGHL